MRVPVTEVPSSPPVNVVGIVHGAVGQVPSMQLEEMDSRTLHGV